MKNIKGHKSWNRDEIIDILIRTGTYTCPTLSHYRYDGVKAICKDMLKRGLLRVSGKTDVSRNLVVTNRFLEWKTEKESGETRLGITKWVKQKYPLKQKTKNKQPMTNHVYDVNERTKQ